MRDTCRWVCWRAVERDGKVTKVPFHPNGHPASSTDSSTWSTLNDCDMYACDKDVGIGFMLGDGWLGVDFDAVYDPEHGWASEWVQKWIDRADTYVEMSPSGTGAHAIFRQGALPLWSQNRRGNVEVYDKARFFCVTGLAVNRSECSRTSTSFEEVCDRYLRRDQAQPAPKVEVEVKDASAEDWRLCCALAAQGWKAPDVETMLRAKMAAEGREQKAARTDYMRRTVDGACKTAGEREEHTPAVFRGLTDVVRDFPDQSPFLVDRLVRRGEVAAVIAPPKCMKSFLMQDLAISLATGRSWVGEFSCEKCRVLLVDNELQLATISERVRKIVGNMGFSMSSLEGQFDVLSLREDDRDLDDVLKSIRELEQPYDFVIFDALYMFLEAGMDENSNADMTVLLRKFRRFATRVNCGVMLVHHTSKGVQSGKDSLDLGAGAGSLGRAVDMHIGIYRHEVEGCFVAQFKTRSSAPVEPVGFEWDYPRFRGAMGLDLDDLYQGKKAKKSKD